MNPELIPLLEQEINALLEDDPRYFLVRLYIKPTNNIKVLMDGDEGLTIEKCTAINRKLYAIIEEKNWFPDGDFSLEISSPGVDQPLLLHRQYIKNIGRTVIVQTKEEATIVGKLIAVTEAIITVEETLGKGKKMVINKINIALDAIKTITVEISFKTK